MDMGHEWFDSLSCLLQKIRPPDGWSYFLEQGTGVEPASEAWET